MGTAEDVLQLLSLSQCRHSDHPGLGEVDLTLGAAGQEDVFDEQERRQQH